MSRYVAFLRGMNLGRRRIKNDKLCAAFEALGFTNVAAFLASGNVVFRTTKRSPVRIKNHIEKGLRDALGYDVPTFLRTADEVRAIANRNVFDGTPCQVALLTKAPTPAARRHAHAMGSDSDRLAVHDRELYWLPSAGILDSNLDLVTLEKALGPMTMRTKRTIERLAAKHLAD